MEPSRSCHIVMAWMTKIHSRFSKPLVYTRSQ